jgi:hypothetical protein
MLQGEVMGQLKWKRQEPGHYTSGDWHVKGTGTNWDLHKKKTHVHSGSSKKECQELAETGATPVADPEDLHSYAPRKKSKEELDSVLASLRLEVDQLALRVSSLDTTISKLTEAVLILGKHTAKLGKK